MFYRSTYEKISVKLLIYIIYTIYYFLILRLNWFSLYSTVWKTETNNSHDFGLVCSKVLKVSRSFNTTMWYTYCFWRTKSLHDLRTTSLENNYFTWFLRLLGKTDRFEIRSRRNEHNKRVLIYPSGTWVGISNILRYYVYNNAPAVVEPS